MSGYDQGIMGSIINTPYFLDAVGIDPDGASYASTISTVTSIYDIGCAAGCLVAAVVGGYLGRKRMIFVGCVVMCVGAAIQCSSFSVGQLIAGRVITGLGNGMLLCLVMRSRFSAARLTVRCSRLQYR